MIKNIIFIFIFIFLAACSSPKRSWMHGAEFQEDTEVEILEQKDVLAVESVDDARLKARDAIQEDKIDLAQAYYVKAYGMDSDNIDLLLEMAHLYKSIKKMDLAERCYQLILKKTPNHSIALEKYGLLLIKLNNYQLAEEKLMQLLETKESEKNWHALNGLGLIKSLQGLDDQAIGYFKLALEIQPKQIDMLNNMGYSLYRSERFKEAINFYKQALAINPNDHKVLFNYALLKARTKNYQTALKVFSSLMSTAEAHNDVGYIAMKNGDLDQAAYYLQQARKLSPRFYKKANDNLQALQLLQQKTINHSSAQ